MRRALVVLTAILVGFFTGPSVTLKLDIQPPLISPGQEVTVSCFDSETLKDVTVTFSNGKDFKWPTLLSDFAAFSDAPTLCEPSTAAPFGLLQKCGNSSGLKLRLRPARSFSGSVRCEAVRNTSDEKQTKSADLRFNWTSSVNISGMSTIDVGSRINIICRFKGGMKDESASMTGIDESWTVKNKTVKDDFGLTLTTKSVSKIATIKDNGTNVKCGVGNNMKTLKISVVDRTPRASLQGPSEPIPANISQTFSCGPEGTLSRPFVVTMTLKRRQSSVSVARVYFNSSFHPQFSTADFFRRDSDGGNWQPITALPADSELQLLANQKTDRLQLRLLPWPRHDEANLTCEINSTYGPSSPQHRSLNVTWKPSVQTVRLQNASRVPISFVLENQSAWVNCSFQLGKPKTATRSVTISTPEGAVKKPIQLNCTWTDRRGFQWCSKLWEATFRREHNTAVVTCNLAETRANFTLNVTYPPTITTVSLSSPTRVGSELSCKADANPPAKVHLLLRSLRGGRQLRQEVVKATTQAVVKVPMCAAEGRYELRCRAKNQWGEDETNSTLFVMAPVIPVFIKMIPSAFSFGSSGFVMCFSEHTNLAVLELQIRRLNLSIVKNISSNLLSASFNGTTFSSINTYPFTISEGVVLKTAELKTITLSLMPKPIFHTAEVTCAGRSLPTFNQTGERKKTLQVRWAPSVRRVFVPGIEGLGDNVVEEKKPAVVKCEAQRGSQENETIRAKIGDEELGNPSYKLLEKDASGFQWTEAVWNFSFARPQNRTKVKCWVPNNSIETDVRVFSKPHNTTLTLNEAELAIFCTSLGNPTPMINLTMLDEDLERVKNVTGIGSATLDLRNEVGNFSFVCVATNSIDRSEVQENWSRAAPAANEQGQLMLLIIVAAAFGCGLALTLLLVSVVKSSTTCVQAPQHQEA